MAQYSSYVIYLFCEIEPTSFQEHFHCMAVERRRDILNAIFMFLA